jgi:hypothetical protein
MISCSVRTAPPLPEATLLEHSSFRNLQRRSENARRCGCSGPNVVLRNVRTKKKPIPDQPVISPGDAKPPCAKSSRARTTRARASATFSAVVLHRGSLSKHHPVSRASALPASP